MEQIAYFIIERKIENYRLDKKENALNSQLDELNESEFP